MKHIEPKKTGIAPTPPPILTVKELAKYLRVHTTTVYRLMSTRQIPGFRVGSDWRFDLDAIDRWCSEGEQAAVSTRHHKPSP
jgi:excisionase family DNA binding protein